MKNLLIKLKQKIIKILFVIILFQIIIPSMSQAADWGGVLFTPIQDFTLALGDVGAGVLNKIVNKGDLQSVITIDTDALSWTDYLEMYMKSAVFGGPTTGAAVVIAKKISKFAINHYSDVDFVTKIELPVMLINPDLIFSNKIPLLDVNIINPQTDDSASYILQSTIAKWYIILRDIAIVAFLSMLVYVGIRIVISSTAGDKAKYKQMLKDWVVGLCLLFMMHYGMSFALTLNEKFVELLATENRNIVITDDDLDFSRFTSVLDADGFDEILATVQEFNIDDDGNYVADKLSWRTDFSGYLRFLAQSNINSQTVATRMGYTIMYIVSVIYTWIFFIKYLKRLLYMTFLTLISPMVAMLYPLDKMNDNSAQTFNTWFKEYIFNLLIQPMHLILYTVLISSAMDLMTEHPIYALVVFGFMLQGEKFIKKMFGFEKASIGPSAAGGAFTGAMVMSGLNKAVDMAKGHKLPSGEKPPRGKDVGSSDDGKIAYANNRTSDSDSGDIIENAFLGDGSNDLNTQQEDDNSFNEDNQNPNEPPNIPDPSGNGTDINGLENPNEQPRINDLNNEGLPDGEREGEREGEVPAAQSYDVPRRELNNRPKKTKGKFKAGLKAYGIPMAKGVGKTLLKGVAMAGAGTAAGMVGVAAGLATDDYSNVVKYGLAGMAGGATVGNVVASNAINRPKQIVDSVNAKKAQLKSDYIKELYKNDPKGYQDALNAESDKEFMSNKEIRQQYAKEFGQENALARMEQAKEYRKYGITDDNIIINAMKETSGEIGKTDVIDSRRIAAAKLASGISGSKDIENMTKRLKSKGYNDKLVAENEEFVRSIKKLKYN